ncbi:44944_t:CDS:2 [Gigaspora margarita]|uniref:44944_t:CDS:1 n=1 Tax=Gigaspora margarita TaxID=4874 RepID=A0ABN7UF96_GIGMA|nr:44944_t:CDS:2 [Gigaspora margarita]
MVKEENYFYLTKKEFNDNTLSDSNKNRLAICRTLARYDKNSGPFEYLINQDLQKIRNKIGKNQYKDRSLQDAQECIEDIVDEGLSKKLSMDCSKFSKYLYD